VPSAGSRQSRRAGAWRSMHTATQSRPPASSPCGPNRSDLAPATGWYKILSRLRSATPNFALRLAPGERPRQFLSFDYRAAQVKFLRGLPPIIEGRGHFSIDDTRLVVALDHGVMQARSGGAVAVERSAFIIPDLSVRGGGPAVVRLNTRSSVTAVLWALDQPPMGVMTRTGLPVDLGDGEAVLAGTLSFPLKPGGTPADVRFDVAGELRDFSSSRLTDGRTLSAARMDVIAGNSGVEIAGQGAFDGIPFDGSWQQPIGAGVMRSAVRGTAQITPAALATLGIDLPEGTLRGQARADIGIDFERGTAPRMSVRSSLRGAALNIPQWAGGRAAIPPHARSPAALGR